MFALTLVLSSSSGCIGGLHCDGDPLACETETAQRCHPDKAAVQACLTDSNGCRVWTEVAECGGHDRCSDEGGVPTCECDHACQPHEAQCRGAVVQTCAVDELGCLFWQNATDCSLSGQGCAESNGSAACDGACQDQCNAFGQAQCSGNVVQSCTTGAAGCLVWHNSTDCGLTGQNCEASGSTASCAGECVSACPSAGATECVATVIRTCVEDTPGCRRWENSIDCAATGQFCTADGGAATCTSQVCTDGCSVVNATLCNGNAIETCALGADGCLNWQAGVDCALSGQVCNFDGSSASCQGQCSDACSGALATQCNGTSVETCSLGADGCLHWQQSTDCSSSGQTCVDNGQTASCQQVGGAVPLCDLCSAHDQCSGYTGDYGGTFCQPLSEGDEHWKCLQDCTNDEGLCQPGETCDGNGNCIPPQGCGLSICSQYNPNGDCPPGLSCIDGACIDLSICSSQNPTGECPAGLSCVNGGCEQTTVGNSPVGGPCSGDDHCADTNASCYLPDYDGEATGFLDGYCMIFDCTASSCPSGSLCVNLSNTSLCLDTCTNDAGCRDGYGCLSTNGGSGVCFPSCSEGTCPAGSVCQEGICVDVQCTPGGSDCDPGESCVGGRCVVDVSNGPGTNTLTPIGQVESYCSLPPLECSSGRAQCSELIQFDPTYGTGYADFQENGEGSEQYRSWLRRDNVMLVKYAAAYVDCLAANWAGNHYPIGLIDMSEQNGAIPGTAVGQPGHPEGTHVDGHDIDISYYQTGTNDNRARPVCDHYSGGQDAYHCTAAPHLLDPWRTGLFIGALFNHPALRIIGVDGQVGPLVDSAIAQLCSNGWLSQYACGRTWMMTYETTNEGRGWYYFHHHHMHVSFGSPDYPWSINPWGQLDCLIPGCLEDPLNTYLMERGVKKATQVPTMELRGLATVQRNTD